MELLLTLILAHLFADFPLQTNLIARLKAQHISGILLHVIIYVTATALLLDQPVTYWPLLLALGIAHFTIDALKTTIFANRAAICTFFGDQCLHLVSMIIVTAVAHGLWASVPQGILPPSLLRLTLSAALLPAGMVCCWIWTINSPEESINQSIWLYWIREQMLTVEQRFGLTLMGVLFLVLATQKFALV